MASGREKKKQHFVPNFYLSAWLDTDAPPEQTYIWLFDKGGGAGRRKGLRKHLEKRICTRSLCQTGVVI